MAFAGPVASVVVMADLTELGMSNRDMYGQLSVNQLTIRAATVMAAAIPIAALYPFLQRFLRQGHRVGR